MLQVIQIIQIVTVVMKVSINRVGDISGEPPTNKATNTQVASKLANLLEGLTFPATKEKIKDHVNRKSPTMGNRINDVFEAIQNNLEDGISYDSVYEIEQASSRTCEKKRGLTIIIFQNFTGS